MFETGWWETSKELEVNFIKWVYAQGRQHFFSDHVHVIISCWSMQIFTTPESVCGVFWEECKNDYIHTVDGEIFIDNLFRRKLSTQNIVCTVHQPIPILVAKVWQ